MATPHLAQVRGCQIQQVIGACAWPGSSWGSCPGQDWFQGQGTLSWSWLRPGPLLSTTLL